MPSSDGMRINVPVTRTGLASPQVVIVAAQMNLGGGERRLHDEQEKP